MSVSTLTLAHAKYSLLETARVPIAVIGSLVFPALSLLFFVVPQRAVAENAEWATQAVISLSVFAVLANALFGFGLNIAQSREQPWDPYLRTLPAPGIARVLGHVFSTGLVGVAAIVPVVVLGALLTAAEASWWRVLLGFVAIAASALPFVFIGISVGYSMPAKAAIAVVQVLMFGLAFGGGLFLPPAVFPDWLDAISRFLPSRHAREIVVWAVQGGELPVWAAVGWLLWTVLALGLALLLFRRDEGRRYR
ncbi:ABC-2 type transport system permease protein [Conyzicola lurida]|uniref:ABC-2 type transport system permease protein n=1 Tax=Conyzicola lurida TaxID=1172621 RepID=A0A841AEN0_9MICO|nr:ABC transporter permease [Conyzicola lurida]MBB5842200.1 ABC-2 type transport system permease protein [Conyzicola lurida]